MSPTTSRRSGALPGYPLAAIPAKRRALEAEGVDVIDLGAGDADLAPPPAAVARLAEAAAQPRYSRYPFQLGLPEFREAVAAWMRDRFTLDLDPYAELLPLIGSKEGIAKLPLAYMDPGDLAALPDPGYQAYRGGVTLAGGTPVSMPLRPENGFLIGPDDLRRLDLGRLKLLFLNYPNNPTAAVASRDYLTDVVRFCREHDVVLAYDHAYSEIAFDGYRPPSILEIEGAAEVAIEFHSFSKTYNMTGWRLGWAAGSRDLIQALSKVKTFMDTGVFMGVQAAGVAALESYDDWVPKNVAVFQARRDAVVEGLRSAGFETSAPQATMYVWVPVPGSEPSSDFALRALEKEGVIVLPGSGLGDGGEGFFRIALTVPEARLAEAVERLGRLMG